VLWTVEVGLLRAGEGRLFVIYASIRIKTFANRTSYVKDWKSDFSMGQLTLLCIVASRAMIIGGKTGCWIFESAQEEFNNSVFAGGNINYCL
jgi:hypothetical protein